MNPFQEMLRKATSSKYHDQMLQFAKPLNEHFGINHFWYYKITSSGYYSYLGTHTVWNEFCFENNITIHFPCLRHPSTLQKGLYLMQANDDAEYKSIMNIAREKFNINFHINLIDKTANDIEAFGFASRFDDCCAEQRLLNDLPLLKHFIKVFQTKHKKFLRLVDDNPVNLSLQFGSKFYEIPKSIEIPRNINTFLSKIGLETFFLLTTREKNILKFIAHGYPSSYIAEQLQLSRRTVENYTASIKCKLACHSKVELIQKTQAILSTGILDL